MLLMWCMHVSLLEDAGCSWRLKQLQASWGLSGTSHCQISPLTMITISITLYLSVVRFCWKATVCTWRKKKVSHVLSLHWYISEAWSGDGCFIFSHFLAMQHCFFLYTWTSKARIINAVLACTTILSSASTVVTTSLHLLWKPKHRTVCTWTLSLGWELWMK